MSVKVSQQDINAAKEKARLYLEARREIIENLEDIDNGSELKQLYDLGFSGAQIKENTLAFDMNDKQLTSLIKEAPKNRLARDLLGNYAKQIPSDPRLQNSGVIEALSSPPPNRNKGRSKKTMRDYFLLCAIGLLVNAGLSRPKSQTTSPNSNSAHVLDELLREMRIKGAYLGCESLIQIWKKRNEIAKDAIDAAHVLKGN